MTVKMQLIRLSGIIEFSNEGGALINTGTLGEGGLLLYPGTGFVVAPPVLSNVTRLDNGSFQFTLSATPGSGYIVEASTNLIDRTELETGNPFPGALTVSDIDSKTLPRRFYRATILP